jgi:chromosome segregation ATPase
MPPQSPGQNTQPIHSTVLPSPSSLNFSSSQSLPSMTPPTTSAHTSAHNTLLQELQHQVTVKTLEFRTLQREYDNLLQKLERQKTKCATLEKKFEVSDVEINSLTEEKEKLQSQVVTMEGQVEELQQSRDEARRQLIANGAQYMRIMEMANRLQSQGAEDKKKWDTEKMELEQRIRVLEEAMVTGDRHHAPTPSAEYRVNPNDTLAPIESPSSSYNPASASQTETINVLRAEISRLRSRTQTLESAVMTMRRESISIQTAARQLMDSSEKVKDVVQDVIREGG